MILGMVRHRTASWRRSEVASAECPSRSSLWGAESCAVRVAGVFSKVCPFGEDDRRGTMQVLKRGYSRVLQNVEVNFLPAVRADEPSRKHVVAISAFLASAGVFVGAGMFWLLAEAFQLPTYHILPVMAIIPLGLTAYILAVPPDFTVRICLWLLTHTFYRIRVEGRENLPKNGPALLVCNHVSFVDPFLIGASINRYVRFLMRRKFYETRGIHRLAKLMGAIPIAETDRPRDMLASLHEARGKLIQGELVCIFAEGSVSRTGNLLRFRHGFERITRGTRVPIIPIHLDRVWGSIFSFERRRFFFKWSRNMPYPVTVTIGKPLPADSSSFSVRQAVIELGAEAFAHRDNLHQTLPKTFLKQACRNWSRLAMADSSGRELNFGRTLAGVILFRNLVRRRFPDQPNLGVLLPPSVPAALLNIGISMAGKIPVNLNYTVSREAFGKAIESAGIKTIFTSEKLLERVGMERGPGMIMMEDAAKEISGLQKMFTLVAARLLPPFILRRWLLPRDVELDSLATIIFSSGSTGIPKGVMLSHRNIVSNIEGTQQATSVGPKDRLLGILPFFHSFGFTVGLWFPLLSGFGVVFHSSPIEARKIGELCHRYDVTILITTPSFAWKYVNKCGAEDFGSLRLAIVGAEKMKEELASAFRQKFGIELHEGYGTTEVSPVVAVGTHSYFDSEHSQPGARLGSVGRPIPGLAVRIVKPGTNEELGVNEEGMLLVKGSSVMMGYLEDPEGTRHVIREGWYVTGDIARLDEDGFITIVDRLSRFSKIGGEMVPHVVVEDALHRVLGVTEPKLVVTSLPDGRKGEKLAVLYTSIDVTVDELLHRLRVQNLPALWVPRKGNFFQIDELPLLGSGKLDLKRIKAIVMQLSATLLRSIDNASDAAAPDTSK